jgi:hypothetical protein
MGVVLGHLGGLPAEELVMGLVPVSALLTVWVRSTTQRMRERFGPRRNR